ncbi:MAG TPA: hypothetical protein VD710_10020 [Nitrososphaeraceae archaeon]|nr:hypothetical protein [Nitrososphaeraceae archaeon]
MPQPLLRGFYHELWPFPTVTSRSILCRATIWEVLVSSTSRIFKESLVSGTVGSG